MDQIVWELNYDLRYQIGLTMGRIFETHRQQVDMYRRMKRRVDNKFNWVKPSTSQLYSYPNGSTYVDLRPQMYFMALDYVTRRETEIEHLVKLYHQNLAEEEVARFRPEMLPAWQDASKVWDSYTTKTHAYVAGLRSRQAPSTGDESMEEKEKELKAKMRSEYYKKRNNNIYDQ